MDLKDLLANKRKRTRTVYVLLDDGLITERDRLVNEVAVAEKQDEWINRRPEAPELRNELRAVEMEIVEAKVAVTFEAMPRSRWTELVEQYTLDDGSDEIDVEAFGPEIIAESWVTENGKVDIADVQKAWETWSAAETEQLYIAAYRVNREIRDIPFISPDTETIGSSDLNSTTADPEE